MASKSKQKQIRKKSNESKHCSSKKKNRARCTVTNRAISLDNECPVKFWVYLNASNHWFLLSRGSCLYHKHHPKLDVSAAPLSEKDMYLDEKNLTSILYDVNVPPSTIAQILTTLRNDDVGTFLPKTVFNINKKCKSLIDVANGILPTSSDAEKTLSMLQLWVLLCFQMLINSFVEIIPRFVHEFVPRLHSLTWMLLFIFISCYQEGNWLLLCCTRNRSWFIFSCKGSSKWISNWTNTMFNCNAQQN